jgi:branched-subunit amino acid aminotransferase/4-amino-4-deoxychorismate lyase
MSAGRVVWLSGRFVAEERARVPATHPLVTHGIGVFETLRLVAGAPPLWPLHRERLATSLARLGLPAPRRDWEAMLTELARRNRIRRGVARLTVGKGLALATCTRLPRGLALERSEGIALSTIPLARAAAELKATSCLPVWLAERDAGGEVALVGERGELLETSRSNLFIVTERSVETADPPRVLPGVARRLVLEAAQELGMRIRLRAPRLAERARWREVFVTNAVRGVRPVASLDGAPVPVGGPDSPTWRLQKSLDQRMGL